MCLYRHLLRNKDNDINLLNERKKSRELKVRINVNLFQITHKSSHRKCSTKKALLKIFAMCNIHRKTHVLESHFNKVEVLQLQALLMRLRNRCFPVDIAIFYTVTIVRRCSVKKVRPATLLKKESGTGDFK